jgi:acetylserotonin N-methyltransferase
MPELVPPNCSDTPIWNTWLAAFQAPALALADDLGLFVALAARPSSAAELAAATHLELRAVETIASLMAGLGFLTRADGRFHLTDVARCYLLPSSPYYWGALLRRIREIPLDCNRLATALRQGHQTGRVTEMWQAPSPPPEALRAFTHAMHAHSFALAMRVVAMLDLAGRILDVGGGSGSYAIAATLRDRDAQCTILDLPPVCDVARDYATSYGVTLATHPADMFETTWPSGFDRVLFSDIFHDWDDARCRGLAARAFGALSPGGRVIVHEMILSDALDGPLPALAYSMVMLFVARGRQRSAGELAELLRTAGFIDVAVTTTASGYASLAATKPSLS